MKPNIEFTTNDIPVISAIKRLVENNRQTLGINHDRAVQIAKILFSEANQINSNVYENKLNSSTLIHDAK